MSDTFLRLIPIDPQYVPGPEQSRTAEGLLRAALPKAFEVRANVTDEVTFVDGCQFFETVECPACGEDLMEWWPEAMDEKYQTRFEDLSVETPCCGARTSLNDLVYEGKQGFARFVLSAMNPASAEVEPGVISSIEKVLGSKVRVIWARY